MSDEMRWRYGDNNAVVAAVDSATVIEICDLLWQDVDDAKPASMEKGQSEETSEKEPFSDKVRRLFAENFLGVAMQRSRVGDTAGIRVATTGVFEFECPSGTYKLGDLVGVPTNDTRRLQNQAVQQVAKSKFAIARVAKREDGTANHSVLVDIRSTVMTGGIEGSSRWSHSTKKGDTMTGKACWYRESRIASWRGGTLLHWGTDYEESEGAYGNYTVAVIVDDETKLVSYVYANGNVCFAADVPT